MFVEGSNGSVELTAESIIIRRKGLANVLTQGVQGDKQVPFKSITAVQFRSAGSMMAGLIQFTILGGREFRGGMLEATKDENAVMFTREQEPAFAELQEIVLQRIGRADRSGETSAAGELERLVALYEKGYLNADEFAESKKQIFDGRAPAQNDSAALVQNDGFDDQDYVTEAKKSGGCLRSALIAVVVVMGLLFLVVIGQPSPKWGERGYKPDISDKCRAAWASMNVDAPRYVAAICTPDEQREIAGYRPD